MIREGFAKTCDADEEQGLISCGKKYSVKFSGPLCVFNVRQNKQKMVKINIVLKFYLNVLK